MLGRSKAVYLDTLLIFAWWNSLSGGNYVPQILFTFWRYLYFGTRLHVPWRARSGCSGSGVFWLLKTVGWPQRLLWVRFCWILHIHWKLCNLLVSFHGIWCTFVNRLEELWQRLFGVFPVQCFWGDLSEPSFSSNVRVAVTQTRWVEGAYFCFCVGCRSLISVEWSRSSKSSAIALQGMLHPILTGQYLFIDFLVEGRCRILQKRWKILILAWPCSTFNSRVFPAVFWWFPIPSNVTQSRSTPII